MFTTKSSTIQIVAESVLPWTTVLDAAHDFSERRPEVWPNVYAKHLEVHDLDGTSADVTEGSRVGPTVAWERCAYDWSEPGAVKAIVTDSNVYRPGSSWEVRAEPKGDGCQVEMTWVRDFKGNPLGRLASLAYRRGGQRMFSHDVRRMLANLEARER